MCVKKFDRQKLDVCFFTDSSISRNVTSYVKASDEEYNTSYHKRSDMFASIKIEIIFKVTPPFMSIYLPHIMIFCPF